MPIIFPFYRQRDAMDCGPACLMMAAAAHGRKYPLAVLREHSRLRHEGVSAEGIIEAAESIGFRTVQVQVPFDGGKDQASLLTTPLPCIAHWHRNHFVVIYKARQKAVWVADPADGKLRLSRAAFEQAWLSDAGQGMLILLKPTPQFYQPNQENHAPLR